MVSRKKVRKNRIHARVTPKLQTAEGWRREMRTEYGKEVELVAPSGEEKKGKK